MRNKYFFIGFALLIFLSSCSTAYNNLNEGEVVNSLPKQSFHYPIDDFPSRVTLKPFGIYISKATSPVQPERFTGFHTGADAEVTDEEKNIDVPVYAISNGIFKMSKKSDGYGGVMAVSYLIDGKSYIAIYGHLDLKSITLLPGQEVKAGQELAILGDEYSSETDGERKHLHFAILPGETISLKGYVQNKSELSGWIDPVECFENLMK